MAETYIPETAAKPDENWPWSTPRAEAEVPPIWNPNGIPIFSTDSPFMRPAAHGPISNEPFYPQPPAQASPIFPNDSFIAQSPPQIPVQTFRAPGQLPTYQMPQKSISVGGVETYQTPNFGPVSNESSPATIFGKAQAGTPVNNDREVRFIPGPAPVQNDPSRSIAWTPPQAPLPPRAAAPTPFVQTMPTVNNEQPTFIRSAPVNLASDTYIPPPAEYRELPTFARPPTGSPPTGQPVNNETAQFMRAAPMFLTSDSYIPPPAEHRDLPTFAQPQPIGHQPPVGQPVNNETAQFVRSSPVNLTKDTYIPPAAEYRGVARPISGGVINVGNSDVQILQGRGATLNVQGDRTFGGGGNMPKVPGMEDVAFLGRSSGSAPISVGSTEVKMALSMPQIREAGSEDKTFALTASNVGNQESKIGASGGQPIANKDQQDTSFGAKNKPKNVRG